MNDVKKIANRELAGKRGNFDSNMNYPIIGFRGGATGFASEKQNSEKYSVKLSNTGSAAVDQVIVLCPAHYTDAALLAARIGVSSCLIIKDGNLNADLNAIVTCSGSPTPVEEFLANIRYNPTRITSLQIQVNNADQFDEDINVAKLQTYKQAVTLAPITLSDKQEASNSNDKLIKFDVNHFQWDGKTIVWMTLKADRTATITVTPGGVFDSSAYLQVAGTSAYTALGVNRENY